MHYPLLVIVVLDHIQCGKFESPRWPKRHRPDRRRTRLLRRLVDKNNIAVFRRRLRRRRGLALGRIDFDRPLWFRLEHAGHAHFAVENSLLRWSGGGTVAIFLLLSEGNGDRTRPRAQDIGSAGGYRCYGRWQTGGRCRRFCSVGECSIAIRVREGGGGEYLGA